jgi:hypothetical protein
VNTSLALNFPGPFKFVLLGGLALLVLGPVFLLITVLAIRSGRAKAHAAFPITTPATADGPGSYRVTGVDRQTRGDRDVTIQADSRANAQVKAELEGIIVTSVTKAG